MIPPSKTQPSAFNVVAYTISFTSVVQVSTKLIYSFGNFTIDTAQHLLRAGDTCVAIEPQVFSLLVLLLENRHRVVLKDEIIDIIWRGRVISDSALSSRIKSLRKALGDSGKSQQWIKTVHSLGFRFVGDVTEGSTSSVQTNDTSELPSNTAPAKPSIVVLPFQQQDNAHATIHSFGLAHDIITSLSRLHWIKVIARASAFKLTAPSIDQRDILSLVGAQYCLYGFIYSIGDTIHLNLQMDDLLTNEVVWAETIRYPQKEFFEIRQRIVSEITTNLAQQISHKETERALLKSTENLSAWEAYHLGMSHFFKFTQQDNQKALALFKLAQQQDPSFARAYAGISSAEFQNAFNRYQGIDTAKSVDEALAHAERSINIDKLDPMANFVMGRTHWLTGEPSASLPWLERALTLNPNYAHAHYAHGLASLMTNDDLRGYNGADSALSLSPLDPFLYGFYGIRAFSYLADDNIEQALLWSEKAAHQPEALPVMDLLSAATNTLAGRQSRAKRWLDKAKSRAPGLTSTQFFNALPFSEGKIRNQLNDTFQTLNI